MSGPANHNTCGPIPEGAQFCPACGRSPSSGGRRSLLAPIASAVACLFATGVLAFTPARSAARAAERGYRAAEAGAASAVKDEPKKDTPPSQSEMKTGAPAGHGDPPAGDAISTRPVPAPASDRQPAGKKCGKRRWAYDGKPGETTANLRTEPSFASDDLIMAALPNCTPMCELERRGKWHHVRVETTGQVGWMYKRIVIPGDDSRCR